VRPPRRRVGISAIETAGPLRPINFEYPIQPVKFMPPRGGYCLWRYALVCDDALTVTAEIRIFRAAVDLAQTDPGHCRLDVAEAVATDGRSVIEHYVLQKQDPPLGWVVDVNMILPATSPPPA
jgi:hypothetical protein